MRTEPRFVLPLSIALQNASTCVLTCFSISGSFMAGFLARLGRLSSQQKDGAHKGHVQDFNSLRADSPKETMEQDRV